MNGDFDILEDFLGMCSLQDSPPKEFPKVKKELLIDIPPVKATSQEKKDPVPIQNLDYEKIVSVHLDSRFSKIKRSSEKQVIPLMVSYKAKDQDLENNRVGLDLVMIIDVSASMSGEKIQLVRETLIFIIDELQEKDRLCLIKFDDNSNILTNLTPMTSEFKEKFKNIVNKEIQSCGMTNIRLGIEDGYDVLFARNFVNDVTSMFLLSDGQDTEGNRMSVFQKTMDSYDAQMKSKSMDYKINSFGYGSGHDEKILGFISNYKNGNFYYIKDLKLVDECFIECLGYLMSIFAQKAEITVFISNSAVLKKRHGSNWDSVNSLSKSTLSIGSIAIGVEKNFIAEIEIPACSSLKGTFQFAQAIMTFDTQEKSYKISADFSLTIVDSDNLGECNSKVEENLIRVQAAETIKEAEEDFLIGNVEGAKCRIQNFKADTQNNQFIGFDFANNMDCMMMEDIFEKPKEMKQVTEVLSKQAYAPGYVNITEMNSVQKQMRAKKVYNFI
jgi:Mg-chelatase subunit ChlD